MTKPKFTQVIGILHEQHLSDVDYATNVGEAMGVELNPYNNSRLIECILDMLCDGFHNPESSKQEIKRFMYEQNFGRSMHKFKIGNDQRNYELLWKSLNIQIDNHGRE